MGGIAAYLTVGAEREVLGLDDALVGSGDDDLQLVVFHNDRFVLCRNLLGRHLVDVLKIEDVLGGST